MPVLYVVEPGAVLRKQGQQVTVEKEGQTLLAVELGRLQSVVVCSAVQVTTQALCSLLEAGVELAIVNARGKLLGQLTPPLARNLPLRRAQFYKERDPDFALRQSKSILAAKMANQAQVLTRHAWDQPGEQREVAIAAQQIEAIAAGIGAVPDVAALLALEGQAAALYWGVFGCLLSAEGVEFSRRRKHPSPDPVNAALSFGYTLLTNLLTSALDAYGFDPFLGFLHSETYGHPSLALDLVEPFRAPVVDRAVVRMFNLGMLRPSDFESDEEGGMRMSEEALRVFFKEWEKTLARLRVREAVREQLDQLARVYRDEQEEMVAWRWSAR